MLPAQPGGGSGSCGGGGGGSGGGGAGAAGRLERGEGGRAASALVTATRQAGQELQPMAPAEEGGAAPGATAKGKGGGALERVAMIESGTVSSTDEVEP